MSSARSPSICASPTSSTCRTTSSPHSCRRLFSTEIDVGKKFTTEARRSQRISNKIDLLSPCSPCLRGETDREPAMLKTTRDMMLPTAITGSYPRPLWFDRSLDGRSFKAALGDSLFREQYLDAVAAIINAQEAAGLDIVTDGDS